MLRTTVSRQLLIRRVSASSPVWSTTRPSLPDHAKTENPVQIPDENSNALSEDSPSPINTHDPVPLNDHDPSLLKQRIREWSDQAAITVRTRADDFTATTRTTFSQLGSYLNKVTGYEEIEALKRQVVEQEARINATRQAARQAKSTYDQAVVRRSKSQREVNDLLQRKSNWTDNDVSCFTTLVRQDHLYEQEEARAKTAVDESEQAVEREFTELMRSILARYHEEQVWSDKIRSASTYGSLAALGLNLVVFVMAILVVEPWKRRRLTQTFERKVEELSLENAAVVDKSMKDISRQIEQLSQAMGVLSRQVDAELEGRPNDTTGTAALAAEAKERTKNKELGAIAVASGMVAGVIGWLAHSWLGS